jgi:hypothetical protein
MRRLASLSLLLMVLTWIPACEPSLPEGRFACEADEDCPDELVCRTRVRRCFSTQADAGSSGESDAGSDAGAGPSDAGDASAGDAGT